MCEKSIVVDLDGTVVDSYGQHFCNVAERVTGKYINPLQLTDYHFTKVSDLTDDDLVDIFATPGYYRDLLPMPGAVEGLRELHAQGYKLHVITVRPHNESTLTETLDWLSEYAIPLTSLHILTRAEGAKARAEIAKALSHAFFVDDNPDNTLEMAKVCSRGFLIDASYNKGFELPDNVTRVNDFQEMLRGLNV